jgi:Ion channel
MLSVTMFITGGIISTYEFDINSDNKLNNNKFFREKTNAFWLMIVTMTTTGYGDAYPVTHPGRMVAFLGCIAGTLLLSLMVVSLTNTASLEVGEDKVYKAVKKDIEKENSLAISAKIIQIVLQLNTQIDMYRVA